jgi:hypothetical protein
MHQTLTRLIDRLDSPVVSKTEVIRWGSPVPSFGDLSVSRVATVGINPSNREFMDESGAELDGSMRRLHTLRSLGLASWSEVDAWHLRLIIESCRGYFLSNPYDTWFKKLEYVTRAANASFYSDSGCACHLDLIPYATARKWTELTTRQRSLLLDIAGDTLALLLKDSPIEILILNGRSVVYQFEQIAGIRLDRQEMPEWSLQRKPKPNVIGIGYKGMTSTISGVKLPREILVLGYNHNLQSSFGITRKVVHLISEWITRVVNEAFR